MLYLEDLHPGQTFASPTYEVTEERIKSFAAEFDPQAAPLQAWASGRGRRGR